MRNWLSILNEQMSVYSVFLLCTALSGKKEKKILKKKETAKCSQSESPPARYPVSPSSLMHQARDSAARTPSARTWWLRCFALELSSGLARIGL